MKAVLLDADGVVIKPRHKYFSEKYSEEYGIPLNAIIPFFKTDYKKAAKGEEDIKKLLPRYLKKWGWNKTTEEFLNYWYESEKETDTEVLELIKSLRGKGTRFYLVSDNEAGRAKYLMEEVGLNKYFDGTFFSSSLGVTKSNPLFFKKILNKLSVKPEEIFYWDDDPENVKVALGTGINAKTYTSFGEFVKAIIS